MNFKDHLIRLNARVSSLTELDARRPDEIHDDEVTASNRRFSKTSHANHGAALGAAVLGTVGALAGRRYLGRPGSKGMGTAYGALVGTGVGGILGNEIGGRFRKKRQ